MDRYKSEEYFEPFRQNIIGGNLQVETIHGMKTMVYADWMASGRLYRPIEEYISETIGPYVGNTHTKSNIIGSTMDFVYEEARRIIKKSVKASDDDALLFVGTGMTSAVNKLLRILGLKIPENFAARLYIEEDEKPIVFVSHMEHNSNYLPWLESIAEVKIIACGPNGQIDVDDLRKNLLIYQNRRVKIGSFTACSNVTGIKTNCHQLAKIMHEFDGLCFIDYTALAPYDEISMVGNNDDERLDAIYFSMHKFLGGPGSSGVLIFDSQIYNCKAPDAVGGGTVNWVNPWGKRSYISNIEVREEGGTPGILQAVKAGMCFQLKEEMGIKRITLRERELLNLLTIELSRISGLGIMGIENTNRIGALSFYTERIHHHLFAKVLNDQFAVQVRSGCFCAGVYGHYLLNIGNEESKKIANEIENSEFYKKPGWVRISIHPTMKNSEMIYIANAIKTIVENIDRIKGEYVYHNETDEFIHKSWFKNRNRLKVLLWSMI